MNENEKGAPSRRGHFVLESGYHTDLWFTLDAQFTVPPEVAPQIAALAELLRPYEITAVCGPLLGGAFLAQALATQMGLHFYFTQRDLRATDNSLFSARYRLPSQLRRLLRNDKVAVVDDCISAGSSVRSTAHELTAAGAEVVVIATMLLLGDSAVEHFSQQGVPVFALDRREFNLWMPDDCPGCAAREPLDDPTR